MSRGVALMKKLSLLFCSLVMSPLCLAAVTAKPVAMSDGVGRVAMSAQSLSVQQALHLSLAQFQRLPLSIQRQFSKSWQLTVAQYQRYLQLMQQTPNGLYYAGKDLTPNEVLAINENNAKQRRQYEIQAIHQARQRVAGELRFNREFSQLEKQLYPQEKPVAYPPAHKASS